MNGRLCASRRGATILALSVLVAVCAAAVIFYFVGLNNSTCTSTSSHPSTNSHSADSAAQTGNRPEDGRLPRHLVPTRYKINLFPNMYSADQSDFTFSGTVDIRFQCLERSKNITLNSNKLDLKDIRVDELTSSGEIGVPLEVLTYELIEKWQFLVIHLDGFLEAGSDYQVTIDFSGPLRTDFAGLYLSTFPYRATNQYVAATQFSPTDARKAFPCFDEPDRKAQFEISLKRRHDMVSLSNMARASTIHDGTDFVTDVFEITPKMSTYLLAMVVGDFNHITREARQGLNYTAWSGRETINKTTHGLEFGAKVLSFFESYFGITFPLPKQDMLAIPETAVGAMENWGLIIFNQNRIFYEQGEYSHNSLLQSTITISHELVHQWFGNLVSMNWWSDLFLKEGFAVYFADVGIENIQPDWNIMNQFAVRNMHSVFDADSLVSSHPVYKSLRDATEIRQVFDSISYTKGGCMIRMLDFILGEADFQQGLKRYLSMYQYTSVGHDQLWEAVEPEPLTYYHPPGVKQVMDTWILQKNYPVVTIRQVKPGVLKIKQERFLLNPSEAANDTDQSPFHYIWKIPLTYTTNDMLSFSVSYRDVIWMEDKQLIIVDRQLPDLTKPGHWVIANIKQWGYYRVNYDAVIWSNLIGHLMTNKSDIDLVNRGQIINDLFSLSVAGMVPLKTALDALEYLRCENEFVPWVAAIKEILYIDKRLQRTPIHGEYKKVIVFILTNVFINLEKNVDTLTMEQHLLRSSIYDLACAFDMAACVEKSGKSFEKWRRGKASIDPDIRATVMCSALKKGVEADWNHVLQMYNITLNTNEKYSYLSALACTEMDALQDRLLQLTGDPATIQARDIGFTLTQLAKNPTATDKVWEHVELNWQKFMDSFSGSLFLLSNLVEGVTKSFATGDHLRALEDFMVKTKDLGPAAQTFKQAVEETKSNIAWLTKHQTTVEQWVSEMSKKFYFSQV